MAVEITIPRLGWNMEEGVFAGWLKHDGDTVTAGESVFSLESDKATQEIECLDSGILKIPANAPKEGDTLAVGTVIAYLLKPGETAPFEGAAAGQATQSREASSAGPSTESRSQPPIVAEKRIPGRAPRISPRAKRVARELGLDWAHLHGSGRSGRIREADVRAAAESQTPDALHPPSPRDVVRRTIAARMLESNQATAPVTLMTTADATNLVNLRNQFKSASGETGVVPSYTDFLVKLSAAALHEHPALNARWENDRVTLLEQIDIGIAVDTPAGLYVPVLRDVPRLALEEVASRSRDLIQRARERKLQREEMQGSTFTVTNLGPFGVDAFTPIINFPECAILGSGRIQRQPVVRGDLIVIRDILTLSLTFDHRVVDGAPAARFLQMLCRCIENPGPCLSS